ncbi:hypothetical protein [Saccharopolyspora shandongensis]|uniref:hypothetical protein n=1 Tax=Saccharopolyspora shandongensis TaxID=418495 RepID=UPI0033C75F4B
MTKNISIRLDDATCETLAELTSDGTTISNIVRTAIIEAAVRRAGANPSWFWHTFDDATGGWSTTTAI